VEFRGWTLGIIFCLGVSLAATGPAVAFSGLATGHVGLIDTNVKGYGYSSYTGAWTPVTLTGPALSRASGEYLGYLRTAQTLYSYNSTNGRWFNIPYTGQVLGEDVRGATTVVWTSTNMYAIASLWTLWRARSFQPDEVPVGGGSASNFGLFWTNKRGYAFHSASGAWMPQQLTGRAISGIANDGFGLLWGINGAFSFDPSPGAWTTLTLGEPQGVSAAGSGSVGLVWGSTQGQAYSAPLDIWVPFNDTERILGGAAGGEVAMLWDSAKAYCFNAADGTWSSTALLVDLTDVGSPDAPAGFSLGPNPSTGRIDFRLPCAGSWMVQVFDVNGALVWSLDADTREKGNNLSWDGHESDGRRVAAGTYWIRAESAEGQVEARRIVMMP
jgi:hypothetical protein